MKPLFRILLFATIFMGIGGLHEEAWAGMSTITLSKFGTDRLIGLSTVLFLLVVVVATILTACWNRLVKDTSWPRLTHPRAVGLTFLTGLLAFLVLIMIAGSRELLSPGAWKPKGILYELAAPPPNSGDLKYDTKTLVPSADTPQARLVVRRESLVRLRSALWEYADAHDGTFPETLPAQRTTLPVSGGLKYRYFPVPDDHPDSARFLVLEPDINEPPRLALDRRGIIVEIIETETAANGKEVQP